MSNGAKLKLLRIVSAWLFSIASVRLLGIGYMMLRRIPWLYFRIGLPGREIAGGGN